MEFSPARSVAENRIKNFLPKMGSHYSQFRNYDFGHGAHESVSCLSPWIRVRSVTEEDLVKASLSEHDFSKAEKFIQEICWRTYWKGWLAQRPSIWTHYLDDLEIAKKNFVGNLMYQNAINGKTKFESFNTWATELIETGYLHNHARMWFASIWIHTFKLPWVLGAAFFLEYLLDGDCASNTLSWRWVAGRQTIGKAYYASAENIRKFTKGRLGAEESFNKPYSIEEDIAGHPKAIDLEALPIPDIENASGLLITDDDVRSWELFENHDQFSAIAGIFPTNAYHKHAINKNVINFRKKLIKDSLSYTSHKENQLDFFDEENLADAVVAWAQKKNLKHVYIAEPAVGFWSEIWPEIQNHLEKYSIHISIFRRPWDDTFFPHAKRGFFNLKRQIPKVVSQFL